MRNILNRCLFLLIIAFAISGCESDNGVQAIQAKNSLHFSPDGVTLSPSDSGSVSLEISGLSTEIFGLSFQIICDSSIISFMGKTETGDLLGQDAISFSQTTESTIHMSITNIQGSELVSGFGSICTVYFYGKSEGDCLISLLKDELRLYDPNGVVIENLDLQISSAIVQIR